jgi:CheY-like chemotaxis protein
VLVVDDDPELRTLIELALDGYRVVTAADGREALDRVDEEVPGLILLDMKMPGMNGWEFAREFRQRFDRSSPIVVITAAPDARARAQEIDAEGYLGKPFDLDDLANLVARHLGMPL